MSNIPQKYLNPDGSLKPLDALIGEFKHNAGPVELSPETKGYEHWFNSDGSPKPLQQIRDERADVEFAKKRIEAEVRHRTERSLTNEDKLVRALSEQIEKHEHDARYMPPAQAREARQYIDTLKAKRKGVEDKVASEKREAEFAIRPEVQLAKEYASTYSRTLPPGCTAEQAAILIALSERTIGTIEEFKKAFWQQAELIETSVHAAREKIAAERREGAAKANAELAEAERALQESRHQQLHPPTVADAVHDAQATGTDLRDQSYTPTASYEMPR